MIGDRWGVTESETVRSYPCDDFVASPTLQAWRGVSVAAPAEAVWPWVVQVRLAPYSYDWIDNLGRRSPRDLAHLPEPRVGDRFTAVRGRGAGRIVAVNTGAQLTGTIMGASMSYVLVPQEHEQTRLLLKVVMRTSRGGALGLTVGDLIMARRQLLNFKQLAERHHRETRGCIPGRSARRSGQRPVGATLIIRAWRIVILDLGHAVMREIRCNCAAKPADATLTGPTSAPDC